MAAIAIQIGIAVAVSALSSKLGPKAKLDPVDRGRLDDLRFTVVEEGAFKPLVYGERVRLAGVIRWATETREYVTRTPGRSSGKGGGARQAEPPTNNYTYRKSFAILVCGNRIRRYRRVWEDAEVIYNADGSDMYADFYEAELAAPFGTAQVGSGTSYSGGRAVVTGIAGGVSFSGVRARSQGAHTLTVFYKESSGTSVTLTVNGSSQTVSLPSTGGAVGTVSVAVTLNLGKENTVSLTTVGFGASTIIDRVHVRKVGAAAPDREPVKVGVLDLDNAYPTDLDNPGTFYNVHPDYDPDGTATGTLSGGGQSAFEFYTGTETQAQSPTIVAVEGASNTPAWRGDAGVVFDDYLLKDGRLGNFTFEVEPDIQDLADVCADLYKQDGRLSDAEIDFSLLAGRQVPGFVVHTRDQLGTWIDALQLWFNFDVVPVDGKVKAVPRGGAPVFQLTEDDLSAHHEGEERPRGPVRQALEDTADVPGSVDVLYIEPSAEKEFHTGAQQAQVQVGDSYDHETLTFPVVGDPDTAHSVGRRFLDQKDLESRPLKFATGPAWRHLVPTDVGDLVTPERTTRVRITSAQPELQGLVKFEAVPERASLYSQKGVGSLGLGRETPAVEFPANTFLAAADCVPLRQADLNRLVVYAAGCGRGLGAWRGFALQKKGTGGEGERLGAIQKAATVGVVETASQGSPDGGHEPARQFVVKLYSGSLESRTLDEVRSDRVNLALYGKGSRWEVIQFVSAAPQTPVSPFVAQYLVTGVFTGVYGTECFADAHEDGDTFVLFDEAVEAFEMRAADVGQELTFVGQTFGQAYADAESAASVPLPFQGVSRLPLAVARVEFDPSTGLAPRDSAGNILVAPWPRTNADLVGDEYEVECLTDAGDSLATPFRVSFGEGGPAPALLVSYVAGSDDKFNSVDESTMTATGTNASVRGVSLQTIRQAGNFVEAAVLAAGDGAAGIGLMPVGMDWRTATAPYRIFALGGLTARVAVKVPESSTFINVGDYTSNTEVRVRVELAPGEVRFYLGEVGDGRPPVYVSPVAPGYPLRAYVSASVGSSGGGGGYSQVRQVMMTTNPLPTTVITADMQQQAYGSLKNPMRVRVRQHSGAREIGYGLPYERMI